MVFYERASGSRMHAAYFRPGGVHQDLPEKLVQDIGDVVRSVPEGAGRPRRPAVTGNRIFKQRNVDIGVVSLDDCLGLGLLGRHGPRLGRRLGPAHVAAALRVLFRSKWSSTSRSARTATATTAT